MDKTTQAAVIEELIAAVSARVGQQHGDARLYSAMNYASQLVQELKDEK